MNEGTDLWSKWGEDETEPLVIPTKWELLVYKWHSKIPSSCRCKQVHPVWKYVKNVFEFVFHKPDTVVIVEYEVVSKLSNSIRDEIDKEILDAVLNQQRIEENETSN